MAVISSILNVAHQGSFIKTMLVTAMQGFYRVQSTQALVLPSQGLQASAFASMGLDLQQLIAVSSLHLQL